MLDNLADFLRMLARGDQDGILGFDHDDIADTHGGNEFLG